MASLTGQIARLDKQVSSALALLATLPDLAGVSRHYIAELVILRTFALFESIVEQSACRLVCGATYLDGTPAQLLRPVPTKGIRRAREAMSQYNRTKPLQQLRWNKPVNIRTNLDTLFPPTEHFIATLQGHSKFIADIRKVRNHIAHANEGTRTKFQQVVLNYYGAVVPSLTPGRMLVSPRFKPSLAERWARETHIVVRAALRA